MTAPPPPSHPMPPTAHPPLPLPQRARPWPEFERARAPQLLTRLGMDVSGLQDPLAEPPCALQRRQAPYDVGTLTVLLGVDTPARGAFLQLFIAQTEALACLSIGGCLTVWLARLRRTGSIVGYIATTRCSSRW